MGPIVEGSAASTALEGVVRIFAVPVPSFDVATAFRTHGHLVLRRARAILRNDAEAEEVLQEVFAGLVARPEQFQGRSALTTFLYSATTHRCLNRLRDSRNRARLVDEVVRPATSGTVAPSAEQQTLLRQVLARVDDELVAPAVHYHVDGMSQAEIGEHLGISRRKVAELLERFDVAAKKHTEES